MAILPPVVGPPVVAAGGIVGAAGFRSDRIAPGSIVSIFGSRLSNLTDKARFLRLWTELAGSQVFLDGIPLPLFFVSAYQINVQIPYETGPGEHRLDVDDPGAGDGAEGVHLDGHGHPAQAWFAAAYGNLERGDPLRC